MKSAFERLLESPEGRTAYCVEQTITNVTELLSKNLNESEMTQADLAAAMGVSPGRVSQLLDGNANLTLKSVARALAAFGQVLKAESVHVDELVGVWSTPMDSDEWEALPLHGSKLSVDAKASAVRFEFGAIPA